MRIWKWTLAVTDLQTISMPTGAELLSVQMQHGELQLWALCDEFAQSVSREIAVYGTGNPMLGRFGKFIGTFQMAGGNLVFHVFDLGEV